MSEIVKEDFNEVLNRIQLSKQKAYKQVNTVLIDLYWNIGSFISKKTSQENWGKSIVKELANYIKLHDPTIKGFSDKNLWRMKQFYETYKDNEKLSALLRELSWTNNLLILSHSKQPEEREFYILLSIKEKLSSRELERQLKSSIFERTMLANEKLSAVVRELPQDTTNVFKDIYSLEFLGLPKIHSEKDLQKSLISSLKEFILELGMGFAFIGQEYRVQVGMEDFYIDLLFFHRNLQCLVAFELKIGKFNPSDLGQLEFYLEALDRDVKNRDENPSIGILMCSSKDDEVVEYALSRSLSPTVISEYETQLIPKKVLQDKLDELYMQLESKN
ncbi:PDDEXK nuclease domain-containing protein [Sulfurimonas sp. NW15]|uniref:PDDEXK nuclease domain-containing protein n=1 Tax=Sulfurimonas sp. NW15 TaxID=2922729 RepID=UPI003DA90940